MKKTIVFILASFFFIHNTLAQTPQKVDLLYKITNQITWKSNEVGQPFIIGVLSSKTLFQELQRQAKGKTISGRSIQIKRFKFNFQIKPVNVLYIDETSTSNTFFSNVEKKLKGSSTLIITEKTNMISKGSHINILRQGTKFLYEMNGQAIKSIGLAYNASLQQGAINDNVIVVERQTNEDEKLNLKDIFKKKNNNKGIENKTSKKQESRRKNKRANTQISKSNNKEANIFLGKVAQEKKSLEAQVLILKKYIQSLEQKLKENNIDYEHLKKEFEKEKEIAEKEIDNLNLIIIEKDSLLKKEREIVVLTKAKKEAAEKEAVLNFRVAVLGIGLAGLFLVAGLFIFRNRQIIQKQRNTLAENIEEIRQQAEEITAQRDEIERQKDKIHEEQQKSENLLLNILPADIAQELKEKGEATPQQYELTTVMFTDFKGFTKVAEQLSPEEVITELNYCFSKFDEIIEKHGLERIKTIGDSYMCVGGLPKTNQTNPEDTIKAALEIQAFMKDWKADKKAKNLPYFECRLGIHSGKVIAGVVGKNKFAYDIWGDTVNLASRMESSGEVDKVNISHATYDLVKDKFDFEHRGKISAKGKGEIDMYFVRQS